MGLKKLSTPENLSLSTQVAKALSDGILDGTLIPGERLVEAAIAEQMNVSRGPVREAIFNLEREGLVTSIPRRGAFVSEWSMRDFEELSSLRMALEGLSARLAAIKITPEQIKELEGTIDALSRCVDLDKSVKLDQSFHCQLAVAADNASLLEILSGMQMKTTIFIRMTRPKDGVVTSNNLVSIGDEHRSILEAVRIGDPDLAEQRMREHVKTSGKNLQNKFRDGDLEKNRRR